MDITGLLIALLVICIVVAAAYWLITNLLPAPFQKWAIAILLVVCVIILVSYLTGGLHLNLKGIR